MVERTVTLQLDDELLHRAQLLASKRSMSASQLIAEQIEKLVDDARYDSARRRAMDGMERGFHSGGRSLPSRDELHIR